MGQHNAKLMLSTLWCGQLTSLFGGVGTRGTTIGIAAPPPETAKHTLLIFDALKTVIGTILPLCSVVLLAAGVTFLTQSRLRLTCALGRGLLPERGMDRWRATFCGRRKKGKTGFRNEGDG
jgi:hypothetical protein